MSKWLLIVLTFFRADGGDVSAHKQEYYYENREDCVRIMFETEAKLYEKVRRPMGGPVLVSYELECSEII